MKAQPWSEIEPRNPQQHTVDSNVIEWIQTHRLKTMRRVDLDYGKKSK